jgi:hypothetical protein
MASAHIPLYLPSFPDDKNALKVSLPQNTPLRLRRLRKDPLS